MRGKQFMMKLSTGILVAMVTLGVYSSQSSAQAKKDWPNTIAIASGTGSTYYAIAGGIGKMMGKYMKVAGIPTKTSGGIETVRLMARNELQMGFITPDCAYEGMLGIDRFKDIGPAPIRVFLQDFPLAYNVVTLEGSGIKSLADLKGKSGYYMGRGSGIMELLWDATLSIYGWKESDFRKLMPFDRASEYIDALITGKVDFAIDMGSHPTAKFIEFANTHPMKIIGWDQETLKKLEKRLPYVFAIDVPGGTYRTMPQKVQLPCIAVVIEVTRNMPDDFVYQLTKMIWTHFDEFKTYSGVCKLFSTEAVKRTNFIYHPGAIKYYKEIGVWTKALDERQAKLLKMAKAEK
jgi:TRAP transporter TAXI family solute receptor